ncbi:13100_t:CDS:2, partial [Racocetra persica]
MKLTHEYYLEIINNLEGDHQMLFSCLFVDHKFCRFTVPLLWADPFNNISKDSIDVVSIYLSYLNKNEKLQLTSKAYQVDLSCISKETLFEYTDFLETYSKIPTFVAIQSMLFRTCKRIKKFYISVAEDSLTFPLISSSWFYSSELRECEFKFVVSNSQNTNVYNYINLISIRNKRIQTIRIMVYNEDILPNCQEPILNLIKTQTELKELELKYFSTTSFTPLLQYKMLQVKSQRLRKLILQGIKFDKDNLANLVPNLEVLSIKHSFGNLFGKQNNLQNLQQLELKELSNEVKKKIVFLLSQNYPNITTLCYVTDNLMFSSTLKKFHKLCQLQIGGFAYYNFPNSSQDYLQALIKYLSSSLKILSLLNIYDYSYENLNSFLQDFDIERVKLTVFILPFNVELNLLPNLRKFIKKAKYLKYIEIVRSENYNIEKQKDSERDIINLCKARNIKCILKFQ